MKRTWSTVKGSQTPLLERLMDKISPEPNSGCWLFTGTLGGTGYGKIGVEVAQQRWKMKTAHRVAYELLRGPIPAGLRLHHRCRVKCCVNPDHLQLESRAEAAVRAHSGKSHPLIGIEARLARRSRRNPRTGCILWQGCKQKRGYGVIHLDHKTSPTALVHRVAWILVQRGWLAARVGWSSITSAGKRAA